MGTTHAFAIHFPVAFLLLSTVVYFLVLVTQREVLKTLFVSALSVGLLGLAAAVITGQFQVDAQIAEGGFVHVFQQHESLAYYALSSFYGVFIWYVVRRKKMQKPEQWMLFAVQVAATGVVLYTAYLGGVLVYQHGAGVVPVKNMHKTGQ